MKIILASASPRRAEILRNAGIACEVRPVVFDETRHPGELRADYVRRLALGKARAAASQYGGPGESLLVGADTIVVAGDEILGKPESAPEARRMLRLLSGAEHEVHTGHCWPLHHAHRRLLLQRRRFAPGPSLVAPRPVRLQGLVARPVAGMVATHEHLTPNPRGAETRLSLKAQTAALFGPPCSCLPL